MTRAPGQRCWLPGGSVDHQSKVGSSPDSSAMGSSSSQLSGGVRTDDGAGRCRAVGVPRGTGMAADAGSPRTAATPRTAGAGRRAATNLPCATGRVSTL